MASYSVHKIIPKNIHVKCQHTNMDDRTSKGCLASTIPYIVILYLIINESHP